MAPGVVGREQLAGVAAAALGERRRLVDVARVRGGTTKGVYRITFDDESTAIVYIWDDTENYWPAATGQIEATPDVDLFAAAHRRLSDLGVRVPAVYLIDDSQTRYPAAVAVVEDIRGGTLEDLLRRDPPAAEPTLIRLAEALRVMRQDTSDTWGRIGGPPMGRPYVDVTLDRALGDLAETRPRDTRIAEAADRLADRLRRLAADVRPRAGYSLTHGELGADHVLVAQDGQPVLIDIEGLRFRDVEAEHTFLRLRFGEHYDWLRADGLDERRMAFYTLAMHLSLVAGPLRLLDGDFPDRAFMADIAEVNLRQALACLT
jgi:Phosphotransferase enzyme family